jgi:hypothetical protein
VIEKVLQNDMIRSSTEIAITDRILGNGSFGFVVAGTHYDGNIKRPVAIKIFPISSNEEVSISRYLSNMLS